ncbi:MAG: IS110 family transposase [Planctomycetota bacterium]|nr:IS110 family transposase [Planctomycetota bacterium]
MDNSHFNASPQASHGRGERVSAPSVDGTARVESIKLGIDVAVDSCVVVRQVDNAAPQPGQHFKLVEFLPWVQKQLAFADAVYSCYEAGPFGYGLHRSLTAMGVRNVVIRPQNWDEFGKRVKTDRTDALAMVQRLDRYAAGNDKALAVVRVPTVEEELARSRVRQREQFKRESQRLAAQGRSLLLYYGIRTTGSWWAPDAWPSLQERIKQNHPDHAGEAMIEMLSDYQSMVIAAQDELVKLTKQLEKAAVSKERRPRGLGALGYEKLRREVCDWRRFSNRRQVASYTGLCPGAHGTGGVIHGTSITKHGNPQLRADLIELAWLLPMYQPKYPPLVKRAHILLNGKAPKTARKKAIVAVARHLAIDLWRIQTGRAQPSDVGLELRVER